MKQAIVTKFLGPTDHRGARVKATCEAGSVTVSWDYGRGNASGEDDVSANHRHAATVLASKLGWIQREDGPECSNMLRGGSMPGDAGYCFLVLLAPHGDE